MTLLLTALAGGLGAITRFVVDAEVNRRHHGAFPLGTLLINVGGSFLLGLVTGLALRHAALPPAVSTAIGTGFCGGYTTFSTASVETVRLWATDRAPMAAGYALASVGASLLAAFLGLALGRLG